MIYDVIVLWALVDVEDVAEAILKAAQQQNIHGKNYPCQAKSLPSIGYHIGCLNNQPPVGKGLR